MLSANQNHTANSVIDQRRKKKGVCIATAGDSIKRLSKNLYRVKSQTGNGWYDVFRTKDADLWSCTCPDFSYRLLKLPKEQRYCKHIIAIRTLQNTIERESGIEQTTGLEKPKICPRCYSTDIVKGGFRTVGKDRQINRQRFKCSACHKRFILSEQGFTKVHCDPRVITEALNLVFSGMSYRATSRHLKMTYGRVWDATTILFWLRKYTEIMQSFVDTLKPELGDVWHVDEIMLNVKDTKKTGKGHYDWCWNVLDGQTRFVLASEISKRREIKDARHAFAKGNENASGGQPSFVITDCLFAYKQAFLKEFNARAIVHRQTKSLSEGFENRPVERYHNELRSIVKSRRGLGNDKSAQTFVDGARIYHNFVRPHTGLPNRQTPAEAANVGLNLNEQNRIKDLIAKSAANGEKERNFEGYVIRQLGKRFEMLSIINEKDCIKFKQKGWIEKQEWREINDILRINGFAWLSSGRDSCWIKLVT